MIRVYTDGSSSYKDTHGGWAIVGVCHTGIHVVSGRVCENVTNNRMELMAIHEALRRVAAEKQLEIVTDSQYAKSAVTEWHKAWAASGWMTSSGDAVKNKDIIIAITSRLREFERRGNPVKIHWVKGHGTDEYNKLADFYAKKARHGEPVRIKI